MSKITLVNQSSAPDTPATGETAVYATDQKQLAIKDDDGTVRILSGDVKGPGSSVDNEIPRFDGTTGKLLQGSGVTLDDNQRIGGVKTATFDGEFDNGNSGANPSVDWNAGQKQKITLDNASATLSFTAPAGVSNLILKIVQDATGGRDIGTWPVSVLWPGGVAPSLSQSANAVDIVAFYYDGANFYGLPSYNFQ